MTDVPGADIQRTTRLLRTYFDHDKSKRFQLERYVGGGVEALAWKIKYKPKSEAALERIVLKMERYVAFFDDDAPDYPDDGSPGSGDLMDIEDRSDEMNIDQSTNNPIKNEEKWLKVLKWAKHIVQIIDVTDDPLHMKISGVRSHHGEHWLYLEWVENGTLAEFIRRANEEELNRLPNRLLWRLFMCLIRMCIAMAWPPQPTADSDRGLEHVGTEKPRSLTHNDIHDVMLGPFIRNTEEPEHDLAPILRLIDFGSARLTDDDDGGGAEQSTATRDNIQNIANIMVMLATLNSNTDNETAEFAVPRRRRGIRTLASEILPDVNGTDPCPGLDPDLRSLICLCRATVPGNIPSISALATLVHGAIEDRDKDWYEDDQLEGDDMIVGLLRTVLADASRRESKL